MLEILVFIFKNTVFDPQKYVIRTGNWRATHFLHANGTNLSNYPKI